MMILLWNTKYTWSQSRTLQTSYLIRMPDHGSIVHTKTRSAGNAHGPQRYRRGAPNEADDAPVIHHAATLPDGEERFGISPRMVSATLTGIGFESDNDRSLRDHACDGEQGSVRMWGTGRYELYGPRRCGRPAMVCGSPDTIE